jgi:hypothetical protein
MKSLKKPVRKQNRYNRNDVSAILKQTGFFSSKIHPVKIVNISKEGIAVFTNQQLKNNTRLQVLLCFFEGQRFTLNGRIVHSFGKERDDRSHAKVEFFIGDNSVPVALPYKYGIQFLNPLSRYSDFLIESGLHNKLSRIPNIEETSLVTQW